MGKEEGGGFRMGNTCIPVADSFLYLAKLIQLCKVKKKKKMFALWKESYDKTRQHVKKQRHHFAGKQVHLVKALIFPVVMYGCESWTIKKAECRRTDAFELWCWRKLLSVP